MGGRTIPWHLWIEHNRAKTKLYAERFRAARRAGRALGTHTPEEWQAMLAACGPGCNACGGTPETVRWFSLVKDHVQPSSKGGSDAIENLQPLCNPCNSRKGNRTMDYRPEGWRERYVAALGAGA